MMTQFSNPTLTIVRTPTIPTYYSAVNTENNTEAKISYILRTLGIGNHIRGFSYLKRAIMLSMEDNMYTMMITKALYPTLAREFNTRASCIERAIRHAIQSIDCDVSTKIAYLGKAQEGYTNKEFIMAIVELMKFDT